MINLITSASISELRVFCSDNDNQVDGDRRKKANYLEAIECFRAETGYYEGNNDARQEYDHDQVIKGFCQDVQEIIDGIKAASEEKCRQENTAPAEGVEFTLVAVKPLAWALVLVVMVVAKAIAFAIKGLAWLPRRASGNAPSLSINAIREAIPDWLQEVSLLENGSDAGKAIKVAGRLIASS